MIRLSHMVRAARALHKKIHVTVILEDYKREYCVPVRKRAVLKRSKKALIVTSSTAALSSESPVRITRSIQDRNATYSGFIKTIDEFLLSIQSVL